jgi:hypothetical protein
MSFMSLFMMFSCSKENNENFTEEFSLEERSSSSQQIPTLPVPQPTVSNGAYKFTDTTHFFTYFEFLDSLLDHNSEAFSFLVSEDMDNPAARDSNLITVLQKLSNDSFENPADRYMPHLSDPVIASFLNLDFEVIVGDQLLSFLNNNQVLVFDASDGLTRDLVRNLERDIYYSPDDVPESVAISKVEELNKFLGLCRCTINFERLPNECNRVRISGNCRNLVGNGSGVIDIEISGLSSTINGQLIPFSTQSHNINGNYEFIIDLEPVFNVHPAASILVIATPGCALGSPRIRTSPQFNAHDGVCSFEDSSSGWSWIEINNNEAISCNVAHWKTWSRARWRATVHSKSRIGNSWDDSEARMSVELRAKVRSLICVHLENRDKDDTCNSCKRLRVTRNMSPKITFHCDGDVTGRFTKFINGQPALNDFQSLSWECCN